MGETSRVKIGLDWNLESKRPLEKSYIRRYFSLGGHDDDKMLPVAAVAAGDLLILILHLAIRVALAPAPALALSTSKHLCAQEVLTSHHNT
jgi:hypothetical protein